MTEEIMLFERIVLPILGMGLGAFAMWGVYLSVNRWLDRRHERSVAELAPAEGTADLRARVQALEGLADQVQELEERLDFTERMLARERDRPALGEGH